MQFSDPLREGWEIYKRFWRHLLPIAFVISLVVAVIAALLTAALGVFGGLLSVLVSLVAVFLLQATLVEAVSDVRDGRADLTLGETVRRGLSRVGDATLAGILAGLAVAVGLVLLIVPGLYLLTFWSLIIPVIVLEKVPVMDSFGRSRRLVSGHGWTVFGALLMLWVVDAVLSIVLSAILSGLSSDVRSFVSSVVVNTIVAPFIAATLTCMYFRLRDLGAAAEAIPAGAAYHED